jgi:hypothetical protein
MAYSTVTATPMESSIARKVLGFDVNWLYISITNIVSTDIRLRTTIHLRASA